MKKFIMIFCTFAICAILISCLNRNSPNQVYADSNNCTDCISVIGFGEYCTTADTVEINFGLRLKDSTIENLYKQTSDKVKEITSALDEIDENIANNILTNGSFIRPIFDYGVTSYENLILFKTSTTNLDKINEITVALNNNGCCLGNISYTLSDTTEAYKIALQKAKENAINKASALHNNLELSKLYEQDLFCCMNTNQKNICVQARIVAVFNCCDSDSDEIESEFEINNNEDVEESNDTAETKQNEGHKETMIYKRKKSSKPKILPYVSEGEAYAKDKKIA